MKMSKLVLMLAAAFIGIACNAQFTFKMSDTKFVCFNSDFKLEHSKNESKYSSKYISLMTKYIEAQYDKEQQSKCEQKLLDFFKKHSDSKSHYEYECSNYQIGHYYAFGYFDPYYNSRPSNIDRSKYSTIDGLLSVHYLKRAMKPYSALMLLPNTPLTNYEEGITNIFSLHENDMDILFNKVGIQPNLFQLLRKNYYSCEHYDKDNSRCDHKIGHNVLIMAEIMDFISRQPKEHPMRVVLLEDLTPEQVMDIAISYKKEGKTFEYLYYSSIAGVRGNGNGLLALIEYHTTAVLSHDEQQHKPEYYTGQSHLNVCIWMFLVQILDSCEYYKDEILAMNDYLSEISNQLEYENERKKQIRAQERRDAWIDLGLGLIGAAANTYAMAASASSTPSSYVHSSRGGNNGRSALNTEIPMVFRPEYVVQNIDLRPHYSYDAQGNLMVSYPGMAEYAGQMNAVVQNAVSEASNKLSASSDPYFQAQAQSLAGQAKTNNTATQREQALYNTPMYPDAFEGIDFSDNTETPKTNAESKIKSSSDKKSGSTASSGTSASSTSKSSADNVSKKDTDRNSGKSEANQYTLVKNVTLYRRDGDKAVVHDQSAGLYKMNGSYFVKVFNSYYKVQNSNWSRFKHDIYTGSAFYYLDM